MYVMLYNLTALQTFYCLLPVMWAQNNTCNSSSVGGLGRSHGISWMLELEPGRDQRGAEIYPGRAGWGDGGEQQDSLAVLICLCWSVCAVCEALGRDTLPVSARGTGNAGVYPQQWEDEEMLSLYLEEPHLWWHQNLPQKRHDAIKHAMCTGDSRLAWAARWLSSLSTWIPTENPLWSHKKPKDHEPHSPPASTAVPCWNPSGCSFWEALTPCQGWGEGGSLEPLRCQYVPGRGVRRQRESRRAGSGCQPTLLGCPEQLAFNCVRVHISLAATPKLLWGILI